MPRPTRAAVVWLVVFGSAAIAQQWLTARRPAAPDERAEAEIVVTSLNDRGPGSLREAVFTAARLPERVRIQLPPAAITVSTPLPPVVNQAGVLIVGTPGVSVLNAETLSDGPVLDIDAPFTRIHGIEIRHAPAQAVLVRRNDVRVTASVFENGEEGVHTVAGVARLTVEQSTFATNRVGIFLGEGGGTAEIRNNRFTNHTDVALWSVRPDGRFATGTDQVLIDGNRFETDRISLVLGNTPVRVEGNEFTGAQDAALILIGEGAVIRDNRVRGGNGVGVIVEDAHGSLIDANEIDHNESIGILVRASGDALVQRNRLYENGYGIAFVLGRASTPNTGLQNTVLRHRFDGVIVIGDSPVLRDNRVLSSRQAGLRILDFYSLSGDLTPAEPLLEGNVIDDTLDMAVWGEYRAQPLGKARP